MILHWNVKGLAKSALGSFIEHISADSPWHVIILVEGGVFGTIDQGLDGYFAISTARIKFQRPWGVVRSTHRSSIIEWLTVSDCWGGPSALIWSSLRTHSLLTLPHFIGSHAFAGHDLGQYGDSLDGLESPIASRPHGSWPIVGVDAQCALGAADGELRNSLKIGPFTGGPKCPRSCIFVRLLGSTSLYASNTCNSVPLVVFMCHFDLKSEPKTLDYLLTPRKILKNPSTTCCVLGSDATDSDHRRLKLRLVVPGQKIQNISGPYPGHSKPFGWRRMSDEYNFKVEDAIKAVGGEPRY